MLIGSESLREIVLGRFVEFEVAIGRALAWGMNLVKKCAAKDFCDAARSDLTWAALLMCVFQLASPPEPIFTSVEHVAWGCVLDVSNAEVDCIMVS